MKYFEVNYPYYALIKAETIEEAMDIYTECVCDDEDGNLKGNIKEVSPQYVQKMFVDANNGVLLVDSSLT